VSWWAEAWERREDNAEDAGKDERETTKGKYKAMPVVRRERESIGK